MWTYDFETYMIFNDDIYTTTVLYIDLYWYLQELWPNTYSYVVDILQLTKT